MSVAILCYRDPYLHEWACCKLSCGARLERRMGASKTTRSQPVRFAGALPTWRLVRGVILVSGQSVSAMARSARVTIPVLGVLQTTAVMVVQLIHAMLRVKFVIYCYAIPVEMKGCSACVTWTSGSLRSQDNDN